MLPAMAIMSLLVALCTATLNLLFNLGWPVFGPALFAAVAMASVNAFVWLTEKSPIWLAVAMASVGAVREVRLVSAWLWAIAALVGVIITVSPGGSTRSVQ